LRGRCLDGETSHNGTRPWAASAAGARGPAIDGRRSPRFACRFSIAAMLALEAPELHFLGRCTDRRLDATSRHRSTGGPTHLGPALHLAGMDGGVLEEGKGVEKCENVRDRRGSDIKMSQRQRPMRVEAGRVISGSCREAQDDRPGSCPVRGRNDVKAQPNS
jgi:hypothetical protein